MDQLFEATTKLEERIVQKATIAKIPIAATFELLPLCNMNCDMCYIRMSKEEMNSIGRIKTADEWLEIAKELKNLGTMFILLTGGEPLLYPEFKKLYTGLKQLGMIITINTNGTLLTKEIAEFLSLDKPRRINITLYGASNETYSKICHNDRGYDLTLQGIQNCIDNHIDIKLNGTIIKDNLHDLDSIIQLSKDLNLYLKVDTYMYPTIRNNYRIYNKDTRLTPKQAALATIKINQLQRTQEEFNDYIHYIIQNYNIECNETNRNIPCRAAKSSLWITWNGTMNPCVFLDIPAYKIINNHIQDTWNQLVKEADEIQLPLRCVQCPKKNICPVCAAAIYCENQSFDQPCDYLCEYTEALYTYASQLMDK